MVGDLNIFSVLLLILFILSPIKASLKFNIIALVFYYNSYFFSYVSPKWVPQMGDSKEVMESINRSPGVTYPVLVPNLKGLEAALSSGATEVAVFGSASEAFSQKNTNSSIEKGTKRCLDVAKAAIASGVKVRGYVSCVFACPYQGPIKPDIVTKVCYIILFFVL